MFLFVILLFCCFCCCKLPRLPQCLPMALVNWSLCTFALLQLHITYSSFTRSVVLSFSRSAVSSHKQTLGPVHKSSDSQSYIVGFPQLHRIIQYFVCFLPYMQFFKCSPVKGCVEDSRYSYLAYKWLIFPPIYDCLWL